METNQLLHEASDSVSFHAFPDDQFIIDKRFCDVPYGVWTSDTDEATRLMQQKEGIIIEGTYSAKATFALIDDIRKQVRKPGEVIVLWDTYCGFDFSHLIATVDYKNLPVALHCYFE